MEGALFETQAGYAVFKLLNEKKISNTEKLHESFSTPEDASKIIKLIDFEKFPDTTVALVESTAITEGKVSKSLKTLLKRVMGDDLLKQLHVADPKLGSSIKNKLQLNCISNPAVQELMRCIRSQADSLISTINKSEMTAMALGLAHSVSRYKLKFSPDKVDTMIVQAVGLLDDLDKELNNYVMRCQSWYGWHFPEMEKIVTDNLQYVKLVKLIGTRENAINMDLSDIVPIEVEEQVKASAETSMGTEISFEDMITINDLCDQIIQKTTYRENLYDYLKARMLAMAPNLSVLVGELVGARLISQAGSLINLSKMPASTLQLLGA